MLAEILRPDVNPTLARLGGSRWCGVLLMALAATAGWLARDLPVVHRGTVGPGAFPWVLVAGLAFSGLVIALRRPSPPMPGSGLTGVWAQLAGMLLFPLTAPWLGTLLALALCGVVIARAISGSWLRACIISPVLAVLLHGVLMWGLGTPLPWWLP